MSISNLVVIDSNFILLPFQFKIDYLSEIRQLIEGKLKFIIYRQILNELEAKRKREPNTSKFSKLFNSGLSYLEKNKTNFNIEYTTELKDQIETTDDFLLRMSLELKNESYNIFLATNDSELRRRARESGLNTVYLRQKKYLSIERA